MEKEQYSFVLTRQDLDQMMSSEEDNQPIMTNQDQGHVSCQAWSEVLCEEHAKNEKMNDSATDEPTNSENDFSSFAYISSKLLNGPKTLDNTFI
jgi:hypothetical protein